MNIAHTKIDAASGAQFCGLANVRRLAAACVIGVAGLGLMSAASASPERDQRNAQRAAELQLRPQPIPLAQPRNDDRAQRPSDERRQFEARSFEARADEQRRMMQMQQEQNAQNDAFRRSGRLTPDERRDLRRQINEAGADIYQSKQRR